MSDAPKPLTPEEEAAYRKWLQLHYAPPKVHRLLATLDAERARHNTCPDCHRPIRRVANGAEAIVAGTSRSKDPAVCMRVGPDGWTVDCNEHTPDFAAKTRAALREAGAYDAERAETQHLREMFDTTRHRVLQRMGQLDMGKSWSWIESAAARITTALPRIRAAVEGLRQPKHTVECTIGRHGPRTLSCTCGTDAHNAAVDAVLGMIDGLEGK
jgi:hypothetical protein